MADDTPAQRVAERIISRAKELNTTPRRVSLEATGKPDTVRDMKRGRMPGADKLTAIANQLGISVADLLGQPEAAPAPKDLLPPASDMTNDMPVLGTALGADLRISEETGEAVDIEQTILEPTETIAYVRRPPSLASVRESYAIYIVGGSMSPRFEPGDPAYVNPRQTPRIGDDVIVQIGAPDPEAGHQVRTVLVKRLVRRTSKYIELRQFQPDLTFKIDTETVIAVHRIVPWREIAER